MHTQPHINALFGALATRIATLPSAGSLGLALLLSTTAFSGGCAATTHAYLRPETPFKAGYKPELAGELWQKAVLASGMKVGHVHIVVGPAAADSAAVYQVESTGVIAMGPVQMNFHEIARLDGQLSQIWSQSHETGRQPDGETLDRTTTFERKAGGWERSNAKETQRVELDVPAYDTASNLPLLLRSVPLRVGQHFSVQTLKWGRKQKLAEAKAIKVSMEVKAAPEGSEAAFAVVIKKEGSTGEDTYLMDADGKMLKLLTTDAPVQLVTTTKEDAEAVAAPSAPLAEGDPRLPVKVFMEVLAGLKDAEALDGVVSWPAVYQGLAAKMGDKGTTLESFTTLMKQGLVGKAKGRLDANTIDMVIASLKQMPQADGSLILAPMGKAHGFQVAQVEGKWMLVMLPQ